jgi:hypothetical protein
MADFPSCLFLIRERRRLKIAAAIGAGPWRETSNTDAGFKAIGPAWVRHCGLPNRVIFPSDDLGGLDYCSSGSDPGGPERGDRARLEAISVGLMVTPYIKSAHRSRLAAGAIGKLDRAETGK